MPPAYLSWYAEGDEVGYETVVWVLKQTLDSVWQILQMIPEHCVTGLINNSKEKLYPTGKVSLIERLP